MYKRQDEDVVLVGGVSIPETSVTNPVAAVHRHSDADDEEEPQRVDHELVGEIEVAVPKRHVEEFLRGVLLGHQDERRDEQRQEAPQNKRVHQTAVEVPVELFLVREHDLGCAHDAVLQVIESGERIVVPRCVAGEPLIDAVGEDGDGGKRKEVEHRVLDAGDPPVRLPGHVRLCEGVHVQ
ncbi:hypothetical protein C487_07352 [Natrinema pallidum DSM 3751]|uniref:Uncharacterized protein n=1 Tax=Natrinema pallidum DSM 3751 TaxID=1227495 RepID=L9YX11_9EURY|nr:hypothetical protein C487_07352 [Natrinema pallidum DSM 3751]